jgi:hypothetical protein
MPKLIYTNVAQKRGMSEKEYNRWYYKQHRERLSLRRKQRWKEDAEYRRQIRDRRRLLYQQSHRNQKLKKREGNTPRYAIVNGRSLFLYRVGALSRIVDRHHSTILGWIDDGVFPVLMDDRGNRWCTRQVLAVAKKTLDELRGEGFPSRRAETEVLKQILKRNLREYESEVFSYATQV